ncbi:sensor histidine kinase [Steroidobacter sp.]|uniref:sensor histidine kinase n=1 Tax=Steroidobacter sp. TaxID=1978227 RepID=UPI001A48FD37|nr:HAMP domain-containing sensor histidine kinase [Steroidobacter sp.]MBL8271956.1 HAMP domain-containing histidine kinase [Steroidobacter sp.]
MRGRSSLRQRIVASVMCYTLLISAAIVMHGYWVNEQAEQRVWEGMLTSEFARWMQRHTERGEPWRDTDTLRLFGGDSGVPVPAAFARLTPGVHDEVSHDGRLYVVLVEEGAQAHAVLALDISEMERRESTLAVAMLLSGLAVIAFLAGMTYFGAQWLVKPLALLSANIRNLRPVARDQQLAVDANDPEEIRVIAAALNEYLRNIDRYVERERSFLNTASHELRTPIAVIAGAAEVAIEQADFAQVRPHLARILATSRSMQDLLALLLLLARDPKRLQASATRVDLSQLVPHIVADHVHLTQGKELSFAYGDMPAAELNLPIPIVQAAVGNLIRNAIENSDRGTIRISINSDRTLSIEDPGADMSATERSQLHARLARAGAHSKDGIGLDLIARLCEHLGWTLRFEAGVTGGTVASLNFQAGKHISDYRLSPASTSLAVDPNTVCSPSRNALRARANND